jgi:hypothetical protein
MPDEIEGLIDQLLNEIDKHPWANREQLRAAWCDTLHRWRDQMDDTEKRLAIVEKRIGVLGNSEALHHGRF